MTQPKVEIDGVPEFIRGLRKVEGATDNMRKVHATAADHVEQVAERLVPVRTGRLKGSVRSSAQAKTGVVRVGFGSLPYAPPIHWGWKARGIKPQPFIYDAIDLSLPEVLAIYDRGLARIIRDHGLD